MDIIRRLIYALPLIVAGLILSWSGNASAGECATVGTGQSCIRNCNLNCLDEGELATCTGDCGKKPPPLERFCEKLGKTIPTAEWTVAKCKAPKPPVPPGLVTCPDGSKAKRLEDCPPTDQHTCSDGKTIVKDPSECPPKTCESIGTYEVLDEEGNSAKDEEGNPVTEDVVAVIKIPDDESCESMEVQIGLAEIIEQKIGDLGVKKACEEGDDRLEAQYQSLSDAFWLALIGILFLIILIAVLAMEVRRRGKRIRELEDQLPPGPDGGGGGVASPDAGPASTARTQVQGGRF